MAYRSQVTGSRDIIDLMTVAMRLACGAARAPLWKEKALSRMAMATPTVRAETRMPANLKRSWLRGVAPSQ